MNLLETEIWQNLIFIILLIFYFKSMKFIFFNHLVLFEEFFFGFNFKNKFLYFILAFITVCIFQILFFYGLLLLMGWRFQYMNLCFALNIITAISNIRQLFDYLTEGSFSSGFNSFVITECTKKLKYIKET